MEADELDFQTTEEHVFYSLGFSHPLVQLMPYEPSAPAPLLMVQDQVWAACDSQRSYVERLNSALRIRPALGQLGLGRHEAAMVAIDLLQGLQKLLLSAAVLEQLAWAFLDRDGIGLEDRKFSSPPNHPLPTLVRLDRDSVKPAPVTRAAEISDALNVWTNVSLQQAAKSPEELDATCSNDLRASLRMLILFLLHGNLDQFRATRSGKLDRLEDMGLSLWDILLTILRKCPEHRQDDEERFGPAIQQAMWHLLRSKGLSQTVAAAPLAATARPPVTPSGTHVVIRGEIPAGTSDEDRQTLARYERLRWPLPTGRLPDVDGIDALEAKLIDEFPWATTAVAEIAVGDGVILTHPDGVKLTHLGEDDGFDRAVDVDPGASSGDTCDGPQGRGSEGYREAAGLLAQHREAVPARAGGQAVRPAGIKGLQARPIQAIPA